MVSGESSQSVKCQHYFDSQCQSESSWNDCHFEVLQFAVKYSCASYFDKYLENQSRLFDWTSAKWLRQVQWYILR